MTHRWNLLGGLAGLMLLGGAHAQGLGTAFSYQGLLEDAAPQGTVYDFQANLFDTPCTLAPCAGLALAPAVLATGVATHAGRFTLELDFGPVFDGGTRYLELQVRRSGEPAFTPLLPRQRLDATPHAQYAQVADVAMNSGPIDAADIVSGNLAPARLPVSGDWAIGAPLNIQSAAFPQTRYGFDAPGNFLARGAEDFNAASTLPATGAGTRLLWYPQRAALRAGRLYEEDNPSPDDPPDPDPPVQWDHDNIGLGSLAVGTNVRASGDNAVALGYWSTAAQVSSFAVGDTNVASGAASVAMGYHAHTNARQGSFVFADRSSVDHLRAGVNHSANWRVSGGFRIFTASNLSTGVTLQSGASISNWGQANAVISTSTGAMLSTGGVWQNASDVARKHLFEEVDGEDVLARLGALPIQRWSYKAEDDAVRHLGPTSQDFYAAFGLGHDTKSIGTVDADGVALAAAQALETRTARQQREIDRLRDENATLRANLQALSKRMDAMETRGAADGR